jgi:hypothetical protein
MQSAEQFLIEWKAFSNEYFKGWPFTPDKNDIFKAKQEFKKSKTKMSEIKKGKIVKVHLLNEPTGQYNVIYQHLELDNGDKIDIGKKAAQQVGWTVDYKLTGDAGQYEFTKAKSATKAEVDEANAQGQSISTNTPQNQPTQNAAPANRAPQKPEVDINDSILYQVSLKMASDLLITGIDPNFENSFPTAESINAFAFEIATIAKVNISKM